MVMTASRAKEMIAGKVVAIMAWTDGAATAEAEASICGEVAKVESSVEKACLAAVRAMPKKTLATIGTVIVATAISRDGASASSAVHHAEVAAAPAEGGVE